MLMDQKTGDGQDGENLKGCLDAVSGRDLLRKLSLYGQTLEKPSFLTSWHVELCTLML